MHTLTNMIAKPIVKGKFWVVEDNGEKVATIQATEGGSFVYVHDNEREKFPSIKLLSSQYQIKFDTARPKSKDETHTSCYGYSCSTKAYNQIWDVQRKLPIYSKTAKSRSFYCAGHYAIKYHNSWVHEYCPKNISISRYEYVGPFKTKDDVVAFIAAEKGK